jgi:hypothetical protein
MLFDDHITLLRAELGIELPPGSNLEHLREQAPAYASRRVGQPGNRTRRLGLARPSDVACVPGATLYGDPDECRAGSNLSQSRYLLVDSRYLLVG